MFKGKSAVLLGQDGRFIIPDKFLKNLKEKYGREVFITSLNEKNVYIFPFPEWVDITDRVCQIFMDDSALRILLIRINALGKKTQIDEAGNVLIHRELMDRIKLKGKLCIKGKENFIVISK